jgi:hypothetical protein
MFLNNALRMNSMSNVLRFFLVLTVLCQACYYDVESELYPYSTCLTHQVSYQQDIRQILERSCLSCHNNDNAALNGNIKLETYPDVKRYVEDGSFLGTVRRDAGFIPMPQDAQRISQCEISKIEAWIDAGALNN